MLKKIRQCSHGKLGEKRWYGIGCSFFAHGAGFTGDGEARIKAKVALDLEYFDAGGPGVNVRVSSTEMGQGTFTILPQMVAEGLSIGIEYVSCPYPDTKLVPDSGPTVASRTAMVVGSTVYGAGEKMKHQLEEFVSKEFFDEQPVELENSIFTGEYNKRTLSFKKVAEIYLKRNGPLRVYHHFTLPLSITWNQETFEGDAYPAYSWGCVVVEVEIDTLTYEIKIPRITADHDIGRVINPTLAKGQVEGGLVQALGYAIMEKMNIKDGKYNADRMQTYVIPSMLDIPEFDLNFVEFPYSEAEPGAKGVGEIPMDGVAPAIANAIKQATGVRINKIPITPESIYSEKSLFKR